MAWLGDEMGARSEWIRWWTDEECSELRAALVALAKSRSETLRVESLSLRRVRAALAEASEELENGRGFQLFRGAPVDGVDTHDLRRLMFNLSAAMGHPLSQTRTGELIADITDEGAVARERRGVLDEPDSESRFLSSRARVHSTGPLRYHTDRCDVVGLLCVRQGLGGGMSRLASSVSVRNAILAERPDLLDLLYEDYVRSRFGEESLDPAACYPLSVFGERAGKFTSHYSRTYIEVAQKLPSVKPLTEAHWEALDLLHQKAELLAFTMTLRPGDIQWVNNHVIYHARDAYEDGELPAQRRLLLRAWLSMPNSRALPERHAVLWGDVSAGAIRGGITADAP